MEWVLYLDDVRTPPWEKFVTNYKIARTYDEAVEFVKQFGFPYVIDLDHDLGEGKNGSDFATWLIEFDMEHGVMPDDFKCYVHSSNPDGYKNIMAKFDSYMKIKNF